MVLDSEIKTIIVDGKVVAKDTSSTFALTIEPDNDGTDFHVTCTCVYNNDVGTADISFIDRPTIKFTGMYGDEYKIVLNRNASEYVQGRYTYNKVRADFAKTNYVSNEAVSLQLTRDKVIVNTDLHNAPKENVIAVAVTACVLVATIYEPRTCNVHLRSLMGAVRERIRKLRLNK